MSNLITNSPNSIDYKNKTKILRGIRDDCIKQMKAYKKKFKRLKRLDDIIDMTTATLTGISISLTITGMTLPPLLLASAITSGTSFIIDRVQDKYNLKSKYTQHNLTINQYNNLSREILAVLTKNNLTQDEYHNYIVEITDKISLIQDTAIII